MSPMHAEAFLEKFALLVSGPGGVQKLRELVLKLAMRGRLAPQDPSDEPASRAATRALREVPQKTRSQLSEFSHPHEIPLSWVWVQLGAISNYGQTVKVERADISDPDAWVLELEDIERITSKLVQRITLKDRDFRSTKNVFEKGQLLYGKLRPYLDKVLVAEDAGVCTTEIIPFSVLGGIDPYYVRWSMKSPDFISYADSATHGMNLPRLGTKNAINAPIPLPPLAEQQRIVAKVDELMALCDRLEKQQSARIELKRAASISALHHLSNSKTPEETRRQWCLIARKFGEWFDDLETINRLRGTILDLSVTGKLVQQFERQEKVAKLAEKIANSRERLIKSGIINRLPNVPPVADSEAPFDRPSGWMWLRYNALFRFIDYRGKTPPKVDSGVRLVTAKNVRPGRIDVEPREFITLAFYKKWMTRGFPQIGDILLTVEAPLGNAAIVDIEEKFALAQRVICLQPWDHDEIETKFYLYTILSPIGQKQLVDQSSGMTATGIKSSRLKLLPLPVPPLEEQKRIASRVDELMALCDRLERKVREKERLNAELMASVVHRIVKDGPNGLESQVPKPIRGDGYVVETIRSSAAGIVDRGRTSPAASAAITNSPPHINDRFKEAVLVCSIVKSFFEDGGEPIGNFRLQKAVYFARRHGGERPIDKFQKMAAGPYNPSMKYTGGIAIAKSKGWLREARGRYGFGHVPGIAANELGTWIKKYGFDVSARWVRDVFKMKRNDSWEILATVDYTILALEDARIETTAENILHYINADKEWRSKIAKLNLSQSKIESAMLEVMALFPLREPET